MGMVRRISALALIVTLSLIGVPLPAHATNEESRPLTLSGLPLSQVLQNAALGTLIPLAGLLEQETGRISGVALDREGEPLANHMVRATRVFTLASTNTEATQDAGTTTTDAAGRFSFMGLRASDYLVEVLSGEEVVASASVTLAAGVMQVREVTVAPSAGPIGQESDGNWWSRLHGGAKAAIIVGAVVGLVAAVICGNNLNQHGECFNP